MAVVCVNLVEAEAEATTFCSSRRRHSRLTCFCLIQAVPAWLKAWIGLFSTSVLPLLLILLLLLSNSAVSSRVRLRVLKPLMQLLQAIRMKSA